VSTILLLLLLSSTAASAESGVIPPGHEAEIRALAQPFELGGSVAEGYLLTNIGVRGGTITFVLEAEGLRRIDLRLEERGFEIAPAPNELSPAGQRAVEVLRETVLPRAGTAFWNRVLVAPTTDGATRGPPISVVPAYAAMLAALAVIVVLEVRGRPSRRFALLALLLAMAPLLVWHLSWGNSNPTGDAGQSETWLQERERHLVQLALAAAIAGLSAAALASLRGMRRAGISSVVWLDASLVLVWSLFVRFGLTTANVLTDGGSGWSRLLSYRRGFSGLAVLVSLVLPDRTMWDSILVPRLLAALSPPLLVLLAAAIGASRKTATFAGLAFASLPLHAALYSSDFESGAVVTILLAGLALIATSRGQTTVAGLAAGIALLGYGIWGRPEALVVGLPLIAIASGLRRDAWLRPAVIAAVAWLAGLAVIRLVSVQGLAHRSPHNLVGPWSVLPFSDILTTSAIRPIWLWLPLPLGLVWLKGRGRVIALAGLFAGLVPLHVTPTRYDPTGTYLEFFRYSAFAMPWLALLAGAGLAGMVDLCSARVTSRWTAQALALAVVIWLVATPLFNRDYLAIRYGPAVDEEVFRAALTQVPGECRLVVPDDPGLHLDVMKRYVEIAREVSSWNRETPPPSNLVGVSTFLRDWRSDDRGCWYFYRGSYCHDGFEGIPPIECGEVLDRAPFEPVWGREVEYRSHRLVSRPGRTVSPWYEPRLELSLFRLKGTDS
jgi:hypothetical protein